MTGASVTVAVGDAHGIPSVAVNEVEAAPLSESQKNASKPTLVLAFTDLGFEVHTPAWKAKLMGVPGEKKQILSGITGAVQSGQLLAIIGPSGAGKTTLLDVNGVPLTRAFLKRFAAYVPQEDRLWAALTVRETLLFSVAFYQPPTVSWEQKNQLVERILADLGLEGAQHTKVGNIFIKGLSGGQKRRLSIGVELCGDPSLVFLDEPTSGLDAAAAASIMELLNQLAKQEHKLIVTSIHQPATRIFQAFDRVILLTAGRIAYFGAAPTSIPYFSLLGKQLPPNVNPADHLLEITNSDFSDKQSVAQLVECWVQSRECDAIKALTRASSIQQSIVARNEYESTFATQLYFLSKRILINYQRDPASYLLRFGLYLFMSCFLGVTYYRIKREQSGVLDRVFLIDWMIAFNSYMGMAVLPAFNLEMAAVQKEVMNGQYRVALYCLSNALVQLPFVLFITVCCVLPAYFIVHFNPHAAQFFEYLVVFFSFLYTVESLGLLIGALVSNFIVGLMIFSVILSQCFIFNGLFIRPSQMPVFLLWIHYLSPHKYTHESLMHTEFMGTYYRDYDECVANRDKGSDEICYGYSGEDVLRSLSDSRVKLWEVNVLHWVLVLWSFIFALRLAHYFVIKARV